MYIDDSVEVKRPLIYWRELLHEWTFMVHRVYRVSGKSNSVHAEKERANTGLLAAAATRTGWVALEESSVEKTDKYSAKLTYSGHCDLVLWRDKRHHEIEAKVTRPSLSSRSTNKLNKAHMKALSDSSRSTKAGLRSEKKIGITYAIPHMKPRALSLLSEDDIATKLLALIAEIRATHKPTILAYAFPGPIKMVKSKNIGVGVILIGNITA